MGTDLTDDLPEIARSAVLQAAIDGLDVSLGDELERYRLWRERGNSITTIRPSVRIRTNYTKVTSPTPSIDPVADTQALTSGSLSSASYTDIDLSAPIPQTEPTPITTPNPVTDTANTANQNVNAVAPSPQGGNSALVKPSIKDQTETIADPAHPPDTPAMNTPNTMNTNLETELDASLEAWTATYQAEIRPTHAPTRMEAQTNPVQEEKEQEEEDASIGIAGIVSIGLIAFSVVAITFLLFDPFGWLKPQRNGPPTPVNSPSSALPPAEPTNPPVIDRELLSAKPNPIPTLPVAPDPPPAPLPAEIPSQVVIPVPVPSRMSVVRPQPTQPIQPTAKPSPTPEVTAPVEPTPPTPVVTMAPIAPEGGNFAVVADPTYQNYVQPIVQPVIRPSDGKLQLGAYGDADTANQKAEEWRRYGVPATVVPR